MYLTKKDRLKKVKAHKSKLAKDYHELLLKISYSKNKERIDDKLLTTENELDDFQCRNERLFALNHFHKKELKKYYCDIRSRAYMKNHDRDDDIQRLAEENIGFIKIIQEYIRLELDQAQREAEFESVEEFQENKKKQDEALHKVIQSEKLIFEMMASSMNKIAKIKHDFAHMNQFIQKLIEDNRILKIKHDIAQYENKSMLKILKEQKHNGEAMAFIYTKEGSATKDKDKAVEDKQCKENNSQSNDTASNIKSTENITYQGSSNVITGTNSQIKSHNNHQRCHTECALYSKSPVALTSMKTESSHELMNHFETGSNVNENIGIHSINANYINSISMRIKELTEAANKEHLRRLVRNNKLKAKKINMIQVIQKCIEDISYDNSILCSSHNTQSYQFKVIEKQKYDHELDIITYIFDNWLFKRANNHTVTKRNNSKEMLQSKSCRLRFKRKS